MMLVCPSCHVGLASPMAAHPAAAPTSPLLTAHWLTPAQHLTPVQPPYVCCRTFQVGAVGAPCLPLVCLACHSACRPQHATCHSPKLSPCTLSEAFRTSLHTSGGGLLEEKDQSKAASSPNSRSASPTIAECTNPFRSASLPLDSPLPSPGVRLSTNPFLTAPAVTVSQSAQEAPQVSSRASETVVEAAPCDARVLAETQRQLEQSGWYYGQLSWQQATALLSDTPVGTFLLRDSANPQCLYALSVQTSNGPTSVRIHYASGKFRMDCIGGKQTPEFDSVISLVQHYVGVTSQVWIDHAGNQFSPIDIRRPLHKTAPSLQHLCRLALNAPAAASSSSSKTDGSSKNNNKSLSESLDSSQVPASLRLYLKSYPHTV